MAKLAINGGPRAVPEGMLQPWPYITEADKQAVLKAMDEAMATLKFTTNHPAVRGLEDGVARYVGSRFCLSANSGTAALHMAVAAAGLGPGDEVITSAYTFLASASCVLHHNAIPVFADIQPDTYNIDPAQVEARITDRTRAVIPVHIHGLPADMDEIMAIARRRGLAVIEDAAQAFGVDYRGRKAGTIGDLGAYSMESSKLLTSASEGGLLVTDSQEYCDRARLVRLFGEGEVGGDKPRDYNALTMGWNYRISFFSAAMGLSLLNRFDQVRTAWEANCGRLSERLAGIPGVQPPYVPSDRSHGFFIYPVKFWPERLGLEVPVRPFIQAVRKALQAEGVPVRFWQTKPVPGQALFQALEGYGKGCPWKCSHSRPGLRYDPAEYPVTNEVISRSLYLLKISGFNPPNTPELMDRYADAFQKVLVENRDELSVLVKEEERTKK